MSRDGSITFDWADGTYTFRLAIGQLRELQEKTGTGPMTLLARLNDGSWRVDDGAEILRLGLIGGGASPSDALRLTRFYVQERPLAESIKPAFAVLSAALFGVPDEPAPAGKETPPSPETDGSSSGASTGPEPS